MWESVACSLLMVVPIFVSAWVVAEAVVGVPLLSLVLACGILFSFLFVVLIWHVYTVLGVAVSPVSFGVIAWGICLALLVGRRWLRRIRWRKPRGVGAMTWGGFLLASFVGAYAVSYLVRALCYPVYVASDAPIYHLPFAIEWARQGRVTLVPTPFGESAATYFPANASCWYAWLIQIAGSELLAKAGQWPFLVAGALAVHAAARLARADGTASVLAACAWAVAPHVLFFSSVPLSDLVLASCMVTAAACLLLWRRWQRWSGMAAAMLFLGAGAGTKLVAVLFVAPLAALGLAWFVLRGAPKARLPVLRFVLLIPLLAAGCAYWYGRNALLTGNPFYPAHVQSGDWVIFQGWYTTYTLRNTSPYAIPVTDWQRLASIVVRVCTPGLVPLYAAAALIAFFDRRPGLAGLVAIVWLHWFLYWVVNPYQTQERFLLGTLALMAIGLARLLTRWRWLAWPAGIAVLIQPLFPQPDLWGILGRAELAGFEPFPPLVSFPAELVPVRGPEAVVVLAAAVVTAVLRWTGWRRWWVVPMAGAAAFALAASASPVLYVARAPRALRFYPVWEHTAGWLALEDASPREGATVAYAGTNLRYYLYGIGLRNRVVYVNVEGDADDLMHDFHRRAVAAGHPLATTSRPTWGHRRPQFHVWLQNLKALGVDLLFVTDLNRRGGVYPCGLGGFPIERTWAAWHPEIFELIASGEKFFLYRVRVPDDPWSVPVRPDRVRPPSQ